MTNVFDMLQDVVRLTQKGQLSEAERLCRDVLILEPENPNGILFLGVIAYKGGQWDKAEKWVLRAIALSPRSGAGYLNMGNIVQSRGDVLGSLEWYQKALACDPSNAKIHGNLGVTCLKLDMLFEAETYLNQALTLSPDSPVFMSNLGEVYRAMGVHDKAMDCLNRAIALAPDYGSARWNRSILLLLKGEFKQGWSEYEWRWKQKQKKPSIPAGKEWDGSDLFGKVIYIYEEQGLGDFIQFARYFDVLRQMGAQVIFEVPSSLLRLMAGLEGIESHLMKIRGKERIAMARLDYHLPLMSLPRLLKTDLTTIPSQIPYLVPEASLVTSWSRRMGGQDHYKIGIVWAGNPQHFGDKRRSVHLSRFLPLKNIPRVSIFSLQKETDNDWTDVLPEAVGAQDLGPHISDFSDTAAIMAHLDLIICVDTAVAHLAGAMGKKVWVLLPFSPDFRWLLGRTDSPWYPDMALWRQPSAGDWDSVFQSVFEKIVTEVETWHARTMP